MFDMLVKSIESLRKLNPETINKATIYNNIVYIARPMIVLCAKNKDCLPKHNIGDAGYDLKAAEDNPICCSRIYSIPTGLKISLPYDMEFEVRGRSGLFSKFGKNFLVHNGTIDATYRGEIKVLVDISNNENIPNIEKGDRIAQGIFKTIDHHYPVRYEEERRSLLIINEEIFDNFDKYFPSQRGVNGFGSTGVKS